MILDQARTNIFMVGQFLERYYAKGEWKENFSMSHVGVVIRYLLASDNAAALRCKHH